MKIAEADSITYSRSMVMCHSDKKKKPANRPASLVINMVLLLSGQKG